MKRENTLKTKHMHRVRRWQRVRPDKNGRYQTWLENALSINYPNDPHQPVTYISGDNHVTPQPSMWKKKGNETNFAPSRQARRICPIPCIQTPTPWIAPEQPNLVLEPSSKGLRTTLEHAHRPHNLLRDACRTLPGEDLEGVLHAIACFTLVA